MTGSYPWSNEIIAALPGADLESFRPALQRVTLALDQVLYEPGDSVDWVYFPENGLISLVTPMQGGGSIEHTSRGRDGAVGYVEACGSGVMLSRAVVRIRGDAWRLSASTYRSRHSVSERLRSLFQRRVEFLLAEARHTLFCRAAHPAASRLALTLLECHHHTGAKRLPLTQDYMAGLIGVGRTTVTHAAGRLQDLKLIRYSRGHMHLLDIDGLKRQVCECYEAIRSIRRVLLAPERIHIAA
jgi:CRP-like cAMP-binding protein